MQPCTGWQLASAHMPCVWCCPNITLPSLCTLQDEQYENLAHIISCDQQTCFVFDFQFTSTDGFSSAADSPPTVQLVFQYSLLVPKEAAAEPPTPSG